MKTALIIIFLVISVILAVIVMMQEGKGGLSGAISGGGADTYWSKNKGKSKESVLKKVSRSWCSVFCTGFGPVIKIHLDFTSCFDKKQLIFLGGVTLWEKKENA